MEKPVDIGALKELVDVPGYFVDVERQEVWSLQKRGFLKEKTWFKLRAREHRWQKSATCITYTNGKRRVLTIGRAVYAAKNGIPYYDLSLSAFNFYYEQNRLRVEEKGEAISRGLKKRMVTYDKHREENVKKNIKVLCLLLQAYQRKSRRLMEYVYGKKEYYVHQLRTASPYRHISKDRAEIGFRLAVDRLIDVIDNGGGIICDFDGWFLKTAYSLQQDLFLKNSKNINIEKVKELYGKEKSL